jgi:hypothetical protein
VALYPTLDYKPVSQSANDAVRGMFTMSGGDYFIAVAGSAVYKVNASMTATNIGTLFSTTGYVSISDNQTSTGLIAYWADGANRYTYNFTTNTFTNLPITDGPWQGATNSSMRCDGYNAAWNVIWACTDLNSEIVN